MSISYTSFRSTSCFSLPLIASHSLIPKMTILFHLSFLALSSTSFSLIFFSKTSFMSGHRHAMISLICMSTHKAMAARCLSYHQAAYRQPAIWALAMAPLRRLALRVLFTIATNSYQTTCTVSERTFNKRQHTNARHGVDFSFLMHYDMVAART